MTEWHNHLKTIRRAQKELELQNRGDNETLANLKDRQEQQRAEVENMRQMAVAREKLDFLEFCRPLVEYREYHKEFELVKDMKDQVEAEERQLKAELEPAMHAVTAKQSYCDQISQVRNHRKQRAQQLSSAAAACEQKVKDLTSSMADLDSRISAEKKTSQKHKADATQAQQKVNRLRRQLEEDAVEFDPAYYNEQLVSIFPSWCGKCRIRTHICF
jgi:chromosome segregation ATPase